MSTPQTLSERAVLVDTSAFYALLDPGDQWHHEAVYGFHLLGQERRPLFTTNLVVGETYALALQRLGSSIALQWLDALTSFNLVFQQATHHSRVQNLLRQYHATAFSYVDAFSFVMMEEMGLRLAFTFDRHFQQYGLSVFPSPLP